MQVTKIKPRGEGKADDGRNELDRKFKSSHMIWPVVEIIMRQGT